MNALIEKQALKELVDTFSNLADEKKVAEQMPLFTENSFKGKLALKGIILARVSSIAE